MTAPLNSPWTEDKVEELRKLWRRGDTCSQIGALIGMSRNAVISKAHRIELPERANKRPAPSAEQIEHRRERKNSVEKKRKQRRNILAFYSGERTAPLAFIERKVDLETQPIRFSELRPLSDNSANECRYIAAEPAGPDPFACGTLTAKGDSWCKSCKRVVFNYQPTNVVDIRKRSRAA